MKVNEEIEWENGKHFERYKKDFPPVFGAVPTFLSTFLSNPGGGDWGLGKGWGWHLG